MKIPENEKGLPTGLLMAFTRAELKALQSTKGDPARRDFVLERKRTTQNTFALDDAWQFMEHLVNDTFFFNGGKKLHKGQLSRVNVLPVDPLVAAMNKLPQDSGGLGKRFDSMDEAKFHFSWVPYPAKEKWDRVGLKTLKTPARRAQIIEKVASARVFIDSASERGEQLVFFTDFRETWELAPRPRPAR